MVLFLCELRLQCFATGVSRLCRMSARCSLNRIMNFRFVSPTYCLLHLLHSKRYTTLFVLQSTFWASFISLFFVGKTLRLFKSLQV